MLKSFFAIFQRTPVLALEAHGATDVGRIRKQNEDAFYVGADQRIYAVADGMGGADCGEVASRCVIQALESIPALPVAAVREVRHAIEKANRHLHGMSEQRQLASMGSTVVGLCIPPMPTDHAVVLHAGDSRIYRLRGKRFKPLTRDHSLEQEFKDKGDYMPRQYKSVITRAIGVRSTVRLEETRIDLRPKDLLLLCSDGLYGMLSEQALKNLMIQLQDHPLPHIANELIREANNGGGKDNITVLLLRAHGQPLPPKREAEGNPGEEDSEAKTEQTLEF